MYDRLTLRSTLSDIPPAIRASIDEHNEEQQLALDGVTCWITQSTNPPAKGLRGRLFGRRANPVDPNREHVMVVAIHPTHLLVSTEGDRSGVSTLSAPLVNLSVRDASELTSSMVRVGAGFTVTGFRSSTHGNQASVFVGLSADHEGDACQQAVCDAIHAAKHPPEAR